MDFHGIHLPDKDEPEIPGEKISSGSNANVYKWGEDKVIKIFRKSYPADLVTMEYYNALAVKNLLFDKAEVVELKNTDFGFGIVYKMIDGENMVDYISRTGDLKGAAIQLADLQKKINKCVFDSGKTEVLETAHQQLRRNMLESGKADSDATREMLRFLGTMKEGDSLCHGNLHPDNVMITQKGPVAVSTACYCIGNPLFDIAKTFFLIAYTPLPGEISSGENAGCRICRGISNMEERKEFGRYYLDHIGKSATEIGGYLSMIIAGMK